MLVSHKQYLAADQKYLEEFGPRMRVAGEILAPDQDLSLHTF